MMKGMSDSYVARRLEKSWKKCYNYVNNVHRGTEEKGLRCMKKIIVLSSLIFLILSFNMIYAKMSFKDLGGYEWAASYINDFSEKGIISGTSSTTFSPETNVKREEFVKIIVELFGYNTQNVSCNFSDVDKKAWYYSYVAAATNAGIINGIGYNRFGTGEYITREDICTILYRVITSQGYELKETRKLKLAFQDVNQISDYAYEAVEALYKAEIINGKTQKELAPKSYATRAEMVKMAYLCDANREIEEQVISVTDIQIDEEEIELKEGETKGLTVTVKPANATNKKVSWKSSDTSIASVKEGKVTAKKEGMATITVTTEDGKKKATCDIIVTAIEDEDGELHDDEKEDDDTNEGEESGSEDETPSSGNVKVTGVSLDKDTLTLEVGDEATLIATITPTNATNKEKTWSTTNKNVATVIDGKVKALKAGTVTITVKTKDGPKTDTCKVIVKEKEPGSVSVTAVTLNRGVMTLEEGESFTLTAAIAPANATNKKLIWSTSDATIVTVNNGIIKGMKKGTATITVKTEDGGKIDECIVTVKAKSANTVAVKSVSLNKTTLSLQKGKSATLKATITPSNATNKNVTWTTSDKSIATVSSTGVVKAVKKGKVTITVKTKDGAKTAKCTVTVTDTTVQSTEKTQKFTLKSSVKYTLSKEVNNKTYITVKANLPGVLSKIGAQTPDACREYSQKYATYILKNAKGVSYTGASRLRTSNKQTFLSIMAKEILQGRPTVIRVTGMKKSGSKYSRHYVTVVGIKESANMSSLKETDFLILDPHKYIRPLGVGTKGDGTSKSGRYLLHSKDSSRSGQKYGYQIYVYTNKNTYLKISGVETD